MGGAGAGGGRGGHLVPVLLLHLAVDVVAAEPELRDLLGQQLHSRVRVAEDDALVDPQLGEQGVQAVHFLLLFHVRVELRQSFERQLLHQVHL